MVTPGERAHEHDRADEDVDLIRELPDAVSFAEGATLGIPCMTAHVALFKSGPVQGRTVLVTGGAGAVGHYAVQLAHWAGATVIATVSSEDKAERARAQGAVFAAREAARAKAPDLDEPGPADPGTA